MILVGLGIKINNINNNFTIVEIFTFLITYQTFAAKKQLIINVRTAKKIRGFVVILDTNQVINDL